MARIAVVSNPEFLRAGRSGYPARAACRPGCAEEYMNVNQNMH